MSSPKSGNDHDLKKHSVVIAGHQTSVTLENIFWNTLKTIAKQDGKSLSQLISEIDESRALHNTGNLSSAIRVYVMQVVSENQNS